MPTAYLRVGEESQESNEYVSENMQKVTSRLGGERMLEEDVRWHSSRHLKEVRA